MDDNLYNVLPLPPEGLALVAARHSLLALHFLSSLSMIGSMCSFEKTPQTDIKEYINLSLLRIFLIRAVLKMRFSLGMLTPDVQP